MKYSGTLYSVHPTKGRVERTVVLDEIVYANRRFWKSKTGWYDQAEGRNFNPRDKWTLDITTIQPLEPDSPLLHPVRQPRKVSVPKTPRLKTPAERSGTKKT